MGIGRATFIRVMAGTIVVSLLAMLTASWLNGSNSDQTARPHLALLEHQTGALRSGDLVFRQGKSALSNAVRTLDTGGTYSHVGIVARRGDAIDVLHVEPGRDVTHVESVKAEPLGNFLGGAQSWAVYRFDGLDGPSALGERVVEIARDYVVQKTRFDSAMSLDDDNELYCTELVWRALTGATGADLPLKESQFRTPLGEWSIILPSAITSNNSFTEILKSTPDRRQK